MSPIRSAPIGALALCLAAALAPAATPAQTVVNFDVDPSALTAVSTIIRSGGVYGGIRWDAATRWSTGTFAGTSFKDVLICHSQPYCSSPNGINPDGSSFGAFGFVTPSRLFGLWVSGPAYTDAVPVGGVGTDLTRVAAELWRDGSLVFTTPWLDVTPTPQRLAVSYAGRVDAVRLVGDPAYTVVDDIAFTSAPEPGTLALAAGGLALVAASRRGRRRGSRFPVG